VAFDWKTLSPSQRALAAGGGVVAIALAGTLAWLGRSQPNAGGPPSAAAGAPASPVVASPVPAVPTGTLSVPAVGSAGSAEAAAGTAAPEPVRTTARITFVTVPPVSASVTWGATKLGQIPARESLVVTRPRDSGPLDVIVRAPGYLPVHTRAHTFGDSRVLVKLSTPEQMPTLLGYRVPIDAGPAESIDETTVPDLEPVAE
jgi:hypothetical protein